MFHLFLHQGIESTKDDLEDPGEPLIDGAHGHGKYV